MANIILKTYISMVLIHSISQNSSKIGLRYITNAPRPMASELFMILSLLHVSINILNR
jgi:hypothetical protein